jgi:hypothetical protein
MEATPLLKLFATTYGALRLNLKDVTPQESLVSPEPGGNCLNWVVGHIVASRDQFFPLLGEEPVLAHEVIQRYRRGSPPITAAAEAQPLANLLDALDRSQERLLAAIGRLTPEKLGTAMEVKGLPGNPSTVFEAIAMLHFHEAYHVGQSGILRRVAGKPGAIA